MNHLLITGIVISGFLAIGCNTTSKCERVDREFQQVVSQREVTVVGEEPLLEVHIRLDQAAHSLARELEPALVASLPFPPESGFELKLRNPQLARSATCPACFQLKATLVGQAAADGVDLDISSGSVELVFEATLVEETIVFSLSGRPQIQLGDSPRMRDIWRRTFLEALTEQLQIIRPAPVKLALPPSLADRPTRLVLSDQRLTVLVADGVEASQEHPEDPLWLNPRHLQAIVQSILERQPGIATGQYVRAENQLIVPVRHFSSAPMCEIRSGEIVMDLDDIEVSRTPDFIAPERVQSLLDAMRAFDPAVILVRPRPELLTK